MRLPLYLSLFFYLFNGAAAAASGKTCSGMGSIAIFGGTGQLGSECVYQALRNGNKVTVLARDPSKMTIPKGSGGEKLAGTKLVDENLQFVEGVVTDQASVDRVFQGNDISGVIIGENILFNSGLLFYFVCSFMK